MKKLLILLASLFFCTIVFAQSPLYELWLAARKDVAGKQYTCIVKKKRGKTFLETREWRKNETTTSQEQDYKAIMDGLSAKGFTYNPQNDTVLIVFMKALPNIFGVRIYSKESFMDYGYDGGELFTFEFNPSQDKERYYDQLVYSGEIEKLIADVYKRGVTTGFPLTVAYRIIIENGRIQYPVLSWAYSSF